MKATDRIITSFILILFVTFLQSCGSPEKKYRIGVSQCSEDSWRSKLKAELQQSTYFNEDVDLQILSADDNIEEQRRQIKQLVSDNVDLLIVSPQQTESLSEAIKTATDKKIPVILFDRMSDIKDYTAFMGADNTAIGEMMGEYAAGMLGGEGNIIEIAGEHGSSPATERHRGFVKAISRYPGLHIIGFAEGDWKQKSGEEEMLKVLNKLEKEGKPIKIDCVFGGNDRMAVGARSAIERFSQAHPASIINNASTLYLGVDALPSSGGGIEHVRDGRLTASAIYPTHGDDLISLALRILKKQPFEKLNTLETSIVTNANASVLLMQHKEVEQQDEYIKKMHNRVDSILTQLGIERVLLWIIIFVVVVVGICLVISVRLLRAKHALNLELEKKNEELHRQKEALNHEKEIAEQQRDELEEQRDKLIEATMHRGGNANETGEDALDGGEHNYRLENEFMQRFMAAIDENMNNSDLSVEELGSAMCLSRVQLYRKVKTMTGKSPVEIIREQRLLRANQLLSDSSLSISEIAYRVGFSSPSYFTKCYRDFFGKAPTGVR